MKRSIVVEEEVSFYVLSEQSAATVARVHRDRATVSFHVVDFSDSDSRPCSWLAEQPCQVHDALLPSADEKVLAVALADGDWRRLLNLHEGSFQGVSKESAADGPERREP